MTFLLDDTEELLSSRVVKKIEIILVSAAAFLCTSVLHAGDTRVWTSRKGTTLEGELLKADVATATVVDKAAKQTIIKMEDLSIADRQYIVQYDKVDAKILAIGEPGEPEKEYRVDEKTFVKEKDKKANFGSADLELMQTEHFIIAYGGDVRPNVFGEAAERIWHGMAFEHMDFRRDWGDTRMMILVVSDAKIHQAVGKWYFQSLKDSGQADEAGRAATGWEDPGSRGFEMQPDVAAKYGAKPVASYYFLPDMSGFKKAMSPLLIHSMSQSLLSHVTGGVKEGAFTFFTGHAYYKEIQLTGQAQTTLGGVGGSDNLSKVSREGFHDKWAAEVRKLVKKGTLKPDMAISYTWDLNAATPENLGLMYALSYYMQSTNLRLSYYDELVRRTTTAHRVPEPIEVASIFGFKSVEAFNTDWTTFIKEGNFK
ncbi:MAG: hypothetical protein JWO82_784 [Akkermansiaceae bacterium]|nr:hypothetical protein [Akkermansiaceae bacterium]